MKILIVSVTLPPENSAVANLIKKLIPHFQEKGCQVDGLTLKENYGGESVRRFDGMTVYYAEYAKQGTNKSFKDRIRFFCKRIETRLPSFWKQGAYRESHAKAFAKAMKKFGLNDYDRILCVCGYYGAVEGVLRYKKASGLQSKVMLLQVDPLTDNEVYPKKYYAKRKAYEKMLYETCDRVYTTPIIYKKCAENGFSTKRATVAEFPLVCKPENISVVGVPERKTKEIRCVFAGYLYPTIRDARYTLELFSRFSNKHITLYILGRGQETLLDEYEQGFLKGRIVRMGMVPSEISQAFMNDADVLVNIGNSVINQVPSKIFDYISRGKCILNTCKSQACPTLSYLSAYPLSINVMEDQPLTDEYVAFVENAIVKNAQTRIPFEEISEQFLNCTPKYVAGQLLEAFSKDQ